MYEDGGKFIWEAEWHNLDLHFTFYQGDDNWQFDELGCSILEYNNQVNINTIAETHLDYSADQDFLLWLHRKGNLSNGLYLTKTGIEELITLEEEISPTVIDLLTYPNPFNPEITISFELKDPERVYLTVYNVRGELVKI